MCIRDRQKPAAVGMPRAQYLLGVCCEFGDGVEQDVSRALALYQEAAGAGYPDAQCALGVLHHQGKGVDQDDREAVRLFRQAAEGGYPRAWHFLGLSYDQGTGVEQNAQEAFRCFRLARQAAKQGGTACAVLNGANEAAVGLFLQEKLGFPEIADAVEAALDAVPQCANMTLEAALDADRQARDIVFARFR